MNAPAPAASVPIPVPRRQVWYVFARRRFEEPLAQVGTVTAEDEAMAAVYARSIYDEHPWIEMVIAPRAATRRIMSS